MKATSSFGILKTIYYDLFFYLGFIYGHSRFTGQQLKGKGISLTPLYHFHPLYGHLEISRTITAGISPLYIASSLTQTECLWFQGASR